MKRLKNFEFLNQFISFLWIGFVVSLTIGLNYTQLLNFFSWYIYADDTDIFRDLQTRQTSHKKDIVMFSDSIVEKDIICLKEFKS
ncbi:MAG: hypothetical protein KatS3mg085_013 [Candidatus Dojkabacteria bacterium]|nr:MAG: hypothetical protein KatS3mg085_013 [Candidatus Dojkabacteria bacterium]